MKIRIDVPFVALLLLAGFAGKGQQNGWQPVEDPRPIIDGIRESGREIRTMQCDFAQEKELSFLEEKVHSSGKFYFERENKIRWEYEEPYSYIIIMNGNLIRIEDEGRSNTLDASSNRLFSSINAIMAGIIDGSVVTKEEQFRSAFLEADAKVRIVLQPVMTGMKDFIGSIELDMNKQDFTVDALKIIERTGDYTLINFKNKQFNTPVREEVFRID